MRLDIFRTSTSSTRCQSMDYFYCQILLVSISTAVASVGDSSNIYLNCVDQCTWMNCSSNSVKNFQSKQSFAMRLLFWNCDDECKYDCMWSTVDWFKNMKYAIPQFHGKWPFLRFCGIQEPASTLFSILNGLVHFTQWEKFRKIVSTTYPMYYVYFGYALVSLNAWIWSTVFHARDLWFTEVMDYLSALLAVVYSTFILLVRVSDPKPSWKFFAAAGACLAFYLNHVKYLLFVKFDYGYNIQVAVITGFLNLIGWLTWSIWHRSKQPYVWKCAATVLLVNLLLTLEVGDFPPFWYILDAHSLWHLSTIPIHVLWYSFAIDDCLYLQKKVDYGS